MNVISTRLKVNQAKKRTSCAVTILLFLVGVLLGTGSLVLPPYLTGETPREAYSSALVPFLSQGLMNLKWIPTVIALFVTGGFLSVLHPTRWWLLACSTTVLLPTVSAIEMMLSPTSHTLWPFEWFGYGLLTVPSVLGAIIGTRIHKKIYRHPKKTIHLVW